MRSSLLLLALTSVVTAVCPDGEYPMAAVYTATNKVLENVVHTFVQCSDGSMVPFNEYSTGGRGTGPHPIAPASPMGSQDSIIVIDDSYLLVANAGSSTISVFAVDGPALTLLDVVPSGGVFPNSLTRCGEYVYVINAAFDGTIVGFTFKDGQLTKIPGSARDIEAINLGPEPLDIVGPAQIAFTPKCDQLVVLVKDGAGNIPPFTVPVPIPDKPGRLFVFAVDDGMPAEEFVVSGMDGVAAFTFVFNELEDGRLLIYTTDVFAQSSSTFELFTNGTAVRLQDPVLNGDPIGFPCWNVLYKNFMYTAHSVTSSIASFTIDDDGLLESFETQAAFFPRAVFTDLKILPEQSTLFGLATVIGSVISYDIEANGTLTMTGIAGGIPPASALAPVLPNIPGRAAPTGLAAIAIPPPPSPEEEEEEDVPPMMGMMMMGRGMGMMMGDMMGMMMGTRK